MLDMYHEIIIAAKQIKSQQSQRWESVCIKQIYHPLSSYNILLLIIINNFGCNLCLFSFPSCVTEFS